MTARVDKNHSHSLKAASVSAPSRPMPAIEALSMPQDGLALSTKLPSGPVPYIDQMHPAGAADGYMNGFANCGPTSMAMVARAFGFGRDMTDARLINYLGNKGGTTKAGSGIPSIVAMAGIIGRKAEVSGPGPNVTWIAEQLKAGKLVVAHGNYYALPPHEREKRTFAGGHFLVVVGLGPDGNFRIHDPLDPKQTEATPEELARFIGGHPSGGHQIAIG